MIGHSEHDMLYCGFRIQNMRLHRSKVTKATHEKERF